MSPTSRRSPKKKRSLEPIAWAALPVLALGVGVMASGVGIDLLVFAAGCLILLTLDRTVGDWLAETLGSGLGSVAFGLAAVGFTWYFISYPLDDFFASAESHGYRSVYYGRTPSPDSAAESSSAASGAQSPAAPSPSPGAGGRLDAPAVLNTETPADGETRSSSDSVTDGTAEGAVTKSVEGLPSQVPPPGSRESTSASRIIFGMPLKTPAPSPSRIMLTLSATQVSPARRTVFQVAVSSEGRPVQEGVVDFTVNGTGVGRATLDSSGVATTAFATHIPGMHEVRARFSGTTRYGPSSSDVRTLHVLER